MNLVIIFNGCCNGFLRFVKGFCHYQDAENITMFLDLPIIILGRTLTMSVIYRSLCRTGDKLIYPILPKFMQPAWNHPAGPKTVFFWAPTIKWALVGAGLADLARPAEKLSVYQNIALAATGLVWTRYCLVITPINYYLSSVNFFVGCTGLAQLARIAHFRYKHPNFESDVALTKNSKN